MEISFNKYSIVGLIGLIMTSLILFLYPVGGHNYLPVALIYFGSLILSSFSWLIFNKNSRKLIAPIFLLTFIISVFVAPDSYDSRFNSELLKYGSETDAVVTDNISQTVPARTGTYHVYKIRYKYSVDDKSYFATTRVLDFNIHFNLAIGTKVKVKYSTNKPSVSRITEMSLAPYKKTAKEFFEWKEEQKKERKILNYN